MFCTGIYIFFLRRHLTAKRRKCNRFFFKDLIWIFLCLNELRSKQVNTSLKFFLVTMEIHTIGFFFHKQLDVHSCANSLGMCRKHLVMFQSWAECTCLCWLIYSNLGVLSIQLMTWHGVGCTMSFYQSHAELFQLIYKKRHAADY